MRRGDRYAVVRLLVPAGFVAGTVQDASGAPAADAVVSADTLPFIGRTEPGDPRYAVVAAVGDAQIDGLELTRGDEASVADQVAGPGAMTALDLALAAGGPRLVGSTPADGAIDIGAVASLRANFSRPLDAASVDASAISLLRGDTPVEALLALSADGRSVSVVPAGGLADDSDYVLAIRPALRDPFGNAFRGDESDGSARIAFRTADVTPPPRPEAGQVTTRFDVVDRLIVEGTQGSAEPGVIVFADNATRGTTISVLTDADGSFRLEIDAGPRDVVTLRYADAASNQTEVPITRPVVLERIEARPGSLLFLAHGEERSVTLVAHFSDDSSAELAIADVAAENTDPAIASFDAGGVVRSLADGRATLTLRAGALPYRPAVAIPISVQQQGETLIEQTVGADGAELHHEGGLSLRIPPGALDADTQISVQRIPLDGPTPLDDRGIERTALAIYQLLPDIAFRVPVEITLPLDAAALGPEDDVLVLRASSPRLDDFTVDDVAPGADDEVAEHEHVLQWFDRENGRIRLLATHFSYRVIMRIAANVAGTDEVLDYEGVRVSTVELDGHRPCVAATGSYCAKPAGRTNKFVVWHSTNAGLMTPLRIRFPDATWRGRTIRLETEPGLFKRACVGNPSDTCLFKNDTKTVVANGTRSEATFDLIPQTQTAALTFKRTVAGVEHSFELHVDFENVPDQVVTEAGTNEVLAGTLHFGRSPASQSVEVEGARDNRFSAHFWMNSRGQIIEMYEDNLRVPHAGGRYPRGAAHDTNSQSVGIEIQHSGYPLELYAGPQTDALLALTDHLLQKYSIDMLTGERGRRRRPTRVANTYSLTRAASDIGDTEAVITHAEQDRDYGDPAESVVAAGFGACGTDRRKQDPCPPFPRDALVAGLSYDFPGLIVTRGGDVRRASTTARPGRGGDVSLRWAQTADAELALNRFRGIPGGLANSSVDAAGGRGRQRRDDRWCT